MMRALARDTLVYGASAILSRSLSLILLPVYTRILSPADYGALDMIMVVGSFAVLLVSLEVTQGLARFYGDTGALDVKRRMASTALWFTVVAYAVATALALAASEPLAGWLFGSANMAGALRIGLAGIAAHGLFYLVQNQLRFELRSGAYAVISLVYSIATLSLGALLGFVLDLGLIGVLWGQFAATSAAAVLGLYLLRKTYSFEWDGALLRSMLFFSLPLVPSGLATFFTLYGNRLLLNGLESLDAVGLFGVASRVATAITLLIVGLQSALTPLIYVHYREPETPGRLARLAEQFTALALCCCLGLGLYAWELLALFAEVRYMGAAPLVLLLAPAILFGQMYIFFPGIAIAKRTRLQLYIFVATAIVTLLLNWLLIPALGVMGAAVATLLSSLLFICLWIATSQRLYPLPIRWARIGAIGLLFMTAGAAGLSLQASGELGGWARLAKAVILLLACVSIIACGPIRLADVMRVGRTLGSRRPDPMQM